MANGIGELQARLASRRGELQKPLSDAIRHTIRTEAGIPEGAEIPVMVFDTASAMVLTYLSTVREVARDVTPEA